MMRKNFMIRRQRAALQCHTFTVNLENSESQRNAKPRFWIAALFHGIPWVLNNTDSTIFQGILVPGIPLVVLEELIPKIERWKLRGVLSRNCTSENSQTQMTFSVGESASRPKCTFVHLLLNSPCRGSMMWRWMDL